MPASARSARSPSRSTSSAARPRTKRRSLIRALAPGFARERPKSLGLLEYARSWAGAYLLRRGVFLPYELKEVVDPDVARDGLRRLKPLRRLAANLTPDPGSDVGRVC